MRPGYQPISTGSGSNYTWRQVHYALQRTPSPLGTGSLASPHATNDCWLVPHSRLTERSDSEALIAFPKDITQILTMKHSDWLRLQSEGESICATLRQQGYLCRKQTRRLSWKLCKEAQADYMLTWLPAPISDWTLMPNDTSPQRQQLWQLIDRSLTSIREEVIKTLPKRTSQAEHYSRPWAIVRLLPDARRYTVARFFNRQDAEDHRRFLNRFMPAAEFEVLFDVPDEQLQRATDQEQGSN